MEEAVKTPELARTVSARANQLFEEHRDSIYQRTDFLFAKLMLVQWLGSIAAAWWITPRTWAGQYSQVHIHVWAALFLGGAITLLPVALARLRAGQASTRYVIASAQMLMSALLIHLTGGRIETHFHVFGSLAILAIYRDWRVFIPATLVVAADHLWRGVFWPQSVFGVLTASPWRWVEHAGWVVFENVFLIRSCFQSVQEMKDIARQRSELEATNIVVEQKVVERTAELEASREDLRHAKEAAEHASNTKSELLAEIERLNDQLKQENTRMSSELEITQRLQQMMLPRDEDLRELANLDVAGFMEPAAEVGGDYYDVVSKDGSVVFGIGDVTGHGLESGVIAIMVQTAVRTLLASGLRDSRQFFDILNRVIYDNIRRMNCDRNLTFSLLEYRDKLVTISGQHEEVLVVRNTGHLERHDTLNLGFPLGLEEDISRLVGETQVPLQSGDVMVAYTDGITEAMNAAGVTYGIERLAAVVKTSHQRPAEGIRDAVLSNLREHTGGKDLLDDISLLVIKPA